jgi:hypothetical protein
MRLIKTMPRTAWAWWWRFGLLIGIPVTVLAMLGLRMVDLERVQRRQQVAEQQGQTAMLVDTSVAAVLNRIERELAQSGLEAASGGTLFTIDRAGSLVLPADRVYFADIGSELVRRQIELRSVTSLLPGERLLSRILRSPLMCMPASWFCARMRAPGSHACLLGSN